MEQGTRLLELTADIVATHVANNSVQANDVAALVRQVHAALLQLTTIPDVLEPKAQPAVSIRSSVKPDHLACLFCGKRGKALRRHLRTAHGVTPDEYRKTFDLPDSYPMVAPGYTEQRRSIAVAAGLGRKRGESAAAPQGESEAAPPKRPRGRPRKA